MSGWIATESPEGRLVDEQVKANRDWLAESATFSRADAFDELWEVYDECKNLSWDGEGAIPVEQDTFHNAYCLIEGLPLGFPSPTSIGAEPDGHITLEWHRNPRWTLSVSVSPEHVVYYAALFGSEDPRGSCPYYDEAPESILSLIRRVWRE